MANNRDTPHSREATMICIALALCILLSALFAPSVATATLALLGLLLLWRVTHLAQTDRAEPHDSAAKEIQCEQRLRQLEREGAEVLRQSEDRIRAVQLVLEQIFELSSASSEASVHARDLAKQMLDSTGAGLQSIKEMTRAVQAIQMAADETASIVGLIDSIAFQTNLLALNAAVEAARAGDSGKGFAVVAEEVRTLAQQSATAARSTAEKIARSIELVKSGVKRADEAWDVLKAIRQLSEETGVSIQRIASSAESQQTTIQAARSSLQASPEPPRKRRPESSPRSQSASGL